jgi:hypothetical protein
VALLVLGLSLLLPAPASGQHGSRHHGTRSTTYNYNYRYTYKHDYDDKVVWGTLGAVFGSMILRRVLEPRPAPAHPRDVYSQGYEQGYREGWERGQYERYKEGLRQGYEAGVRAGQLR